MKKRSAAKAQPKKADRIARPANPQEQSPFFRLPQKLRLAIYKMAFPRITSPQLVYIDVDNSVSFNEVGNGKAPSESGRLRRVVCNGIFEDGGTEIREIRSAARKNAAGTNTKRIKGRYSRSNEELTSSLPLLLACRRMYEEVAPHCDQSLAFQDFLSLETFFSRVSDGVLPHGLLDRLNNVSVDVTFSKDGAFRPSLRKKILASWADACKRLAALKSMQCFRLRLEVPISQSPSLYNTGVPGGIHVSMIKELNAVAANTPDTEVQLRLTSLVNPSADLCYNRTEQVRIYQRGQAQYVEVPGWKSRLP